jgi:hypothetical protein
VTQRIPNNASSLSALSNNQIYIKGDLLLRTQGLAVSAAEGLFSSVKYVIELAANELFRGGLCFTY